MRQGVAVSLLITVLCMTCWADLPNISYCQYVSHFDCNTLQKNVLCGSDGVTYRNDCQFSQKNCQNSRLRIAHRGSCKAAQQVTGASTTGAELAFDIFCLDLFKHSCDSDKQHAVCGSNGVTYPSLCEFDKQRCTHRHIYITKMASC